MEGGRIWSVISDRQWGVDGQMEGDAIEERAWLKIIEEDSYSMIMMRAHNLYMRVVFIHIAVSKRAVSVRMVNINLQRVVSNRVLPHSSIWRDWLAAMHMLATSVCTLHVSVGGECITCTVWLCTCHQVAQWCDYTFRSWCGSMSLWHQDYIFQHWVLSEFVYRKLHMLAELSNCELYIYSTSKINTYLHQSHHILRC